MPLALNPFPGKPGVGSYERECKTLYVNYGGAGTLPTDKVGAGLDCAMEEEGSRPACRRYAGCELNRPGNALLLPPLNNTLHLQRRCAHHAALPATRAPAANPRYRIALHGSTSVLLVPLCRRCDRLWGRTLPNGAPLTTSTWCPPRLSHSSGEHLHTASQCRPPLPT
jgi:hypothetical protein